MENITFATYENDVQKFYLTAKVADPTGRLENLSPGVFRDICIGLFDTGLNNADQIIFREFFKVKGEGDLRKAIERFDLGKTKSVINFIKNATSPSDSLRVEMAAILIGFNPRPYNVFSKKYKQLSLQPEEESIQKLSYIHVSEYNQLGTPEKKAIDLSDEVFSSKISSEAKLSSQKMFFVAAIVLTVLVVAYVVKKEVYPSKDCLQWASDHYETVSCGGTKIESLYEARILERNTELLNFRKLRISEKTQFFINGKPAVWYLKDHNIVEFFNAPGLHPISGKSLKPVTNHIVEKYGKQF